MGLSRVVSEIFNVENMATLKFSRKSQNFPTPYILCPAEGVPLGIGYRSMGSKTTVMGLPGRERSLTKFSAVWIQSTNVTDGQTDGHRATANTALTHSIATF